MKLLRAASIVNWEFIIGLCTITNIVSELSANNNYSVQITPAFLTLIIQIIDTVKKFERKQEDKGLWDNYH
jgi:hypothetical protein